MSIVYTKFTILSLGVICLILGSVYLGLGNTFENKFLGTLVRGDVLTETSCSKRCNRDSTPCQNKCSSKYYVNEIFVINNATISTCTVKRLTSYSRREYAENFISKMILGTSRNLYQLLGSQVNCIDDKIRDYYNIAGGVFFRILYCCFYSFWFSFFT